MEKPKRFIVHVTMKVIAPNGTDLTPEGEFYLLASGTLTDAVRTQAKIDKFLKQFITEPVNGQNTTVPA